MATKKEIKELLKTMNLTENDIDNYWNELLDTNWLVKNLNNSGKTWRDMNTTVIAKIPTQKQRDIETAELKAKKDIEEKSKELSKKEQEDYYE